MRKQIRFNGLLALLMAFALVVNTGFAGFSETLVSTSPSSNSQSSLIGKYVDFGKYQGETVNWQIISVDAQQNITLWSTKALCLKMLSYHDCRYPTLVDDPEWEAEYWKGSTLRAWLNSADQKVQWMFQPAKHNTDYYGSSDYDYDQEPGFLNSFSTWERQALLMNTRNNISRFKEPLPTEDLVYVLSVKEVMDLKAKSFSIVKEGTEYVWKQIPDQIGVFGKTIPYWTDTTDFLGGMLIDATGAEDNYGAFLQPYNVSGICPAVTVKADQFKVSKGNGSKNSPFVLDANGNQTVGSLSASAVSGSSNVSADIGLWAVEKGLISQAETKLLMKSINNEQLAVLAYRLYVELGGTKLKSADPQLAKDTKNQEALKAVSLNLISTQGIGQIGVKVSASKIALARAVYEIYQLVEEKAADTRKLNGYKDLAAADSDNDAKICDFLVTYSIMVPKDPKNFGVKDQMTLAQVLGILKKFSEHVTDLPKYDAYPGQVIGIGWAGNQIDHINFNLQYWKTNNNIVNSVDVFSKQMAEDLKAFQKDNGLPLTGQVDFVTWERLNNSMLWGAKNEEVKFASAEIERCVRNQLNQPEGPLMDTQINSMRELNLLDDYKVTSLEDLPKFKNLNKLYLEKQPVTNLGDLSAIKRLTEFYAIDMPQLDLSPIGEMVDLTTVVIQGCQLRDIQLLSPLRKLTKVALDHNDIMDLGPLVGKPLLDLAVEDNEISDIKVLSSFKNLLLLNLAKNKISDLRPLEGLKKIDYLDVSENPLETLAPLKSVTTLTLFDCEKTDMLDLSPLAGNKDLEIIKAAKNRIKQIDVIQNFKNLNYLDINYNQVNSLESLRGLKKLDYLKVYGNPIRDLSALETAVKLRYLYIDTLNLNYSILKPLPELIGVSVRVNLDSADLAVEKLAQLAGKNGLSIRTNFWIGDGTHGGFGLTPEYNFDVETLKDPVAREKLHGLYERARVSKNQILAEITKPGMTELDKVTYVNQWLIDHVEYDYDDYHGITFNPLNYNPIGVLAGSDSGNRLAVCAGYAFTAEYLLKAAGVTCYTVLGNVDGPTGIGHAWNLVKIEGNYYHMDSTWNDSEDRPNQYFLISDVEIQSAGNRYWIVEDYPAAPMRYSR